MSNRLIFEYEGAEHTTTINFGENVMSIVQNIALLEFEAKLVGIEKEPEVSTERIRNLGRGVLFDTGLAVITHSNEEPPRIEALTRAEYIIMEIFCRNTNTILSDKQLSEIDGISVIAPSAVRVHLSSLRSKLSPHEEIIETCRGRGHRFGMK